MLRNKAEIPLNKKMSNFKEKQRRIGKVPSFKFREFRPWWRAQSCSVCGEPIVDCPLHDVFIQPMDDQVVEYGIQNLKVTHKLCFFHPPE